MIKQIFFMGLLMLFAFYNFPAEAASVGDGKKILYVPLDSRPVNLKQAKEVAEKTGYEILTPPEEFLGTLENYGEPEKILNWLNENAFGATAAVISSDSIIYGSLVGSRMHNLEPEEILNRAAKLKQFREDFPNLPIYVFGTIMRTPRSGSNSSAEPAYYKEYGAKIFEYTVYKDMEETGNLSGRNKRKMRRLEKEIPAEYLADWLNRRKKNYAAHEYLIDEVKAGTFDYFLLGCDDSAIFSQTHLESRHLTEYGKDLENWRFIVTSGADELGILMLGRAINKDLNEIPFVAAVYNEGTGAKTIPDYCNEEIGISLRAATFAVGGLPVPSPEKADLIVAVSTNINGKTEDSSSPKNTIKPRRSTKKFMSVLKNLPVEISRVGIADIAFGNGADNALMEQLRKENLQFKINSYGGWNTATNSSGFLIGTGVLTKFMTQRQKNSLLITRYLDDWGYQANVRQKTDPIFWKMQSEGNKAGLPEAEEKAGELMKKFVEENLILPPGDVLDNIKVTFPWERRFECDVNFNFF